MLSYRVPSWALKQRRPASSAVPGSIGRVECNRVHYIVGCGGTVSVILYAFLSGYQLPSIQGPFPGLGHDSLARVWLDADEYALTGHRYYERIRKRRRLMGAAMEPQGRRGAGTG